MKPWMLLLLGGCATGPNVSGAGTSADGSVAWFAVTRGDEITYVRCELSGCESVSASAVGAGTGDPSDAREAAVGGDSAQAPSETSANGSEGDSGEDAVDSSPAEENAEGDAPQEERLDLMNGVI